MDSTDDRSRFKDDIDRDPGIGSSKGTFATGKDAESIDGENSIEGDVENDSTHGGGADPAQLGRTNE